MLPMIGTIEARVVGATEVSIHGDRYMDVLVEPAGAAGQLRLAGSRVQLRIPMHAFDGGVPAKAGDTVRLDLLMGQVTRATVLANEQ